MAALSHIEGPGVWWLISDAGGSGRSAEPLRLRGRLAAWFRPHRFWGEPAVGRVRPDVLVVDDDPDPGQGGEDLLVHAFVAQLAVEAFNEAVLPPLARCKVMPFMQAGPDACTDPINLIQWLEATKDARRAIEKINLSVLIALTTSERTQ